MITATNPLMTALSTLQLSAVPAHAAAPFSATVLTGKNSHTSLSLPPLSRILIDMRNVDSARARIHFVTEKTGLQRLTRFADTARKALAFADQKAGVSGSWSVEVSDDSLRSLGIYAASLDVPRNWVKDSLLAALRAFDKDDLAVRSEVQGESRFSHTLYPDRFSAFLRMLLGALNVEIPEVLPPSSQAWSPITHGVEGERNVPGDAPYQAARSAWPSVAAGNNAAGEARFTSPDAAAAGVAVYP